MIPKIETFTKEEKLELAKIVVKTARDWTKQARYKHATAQADLAGALAAQEAFKQEQDTYDMGDWSRTARYGTTITSARASAEEAQKEAQKFEKLEAYIVDKFLEEGV